MNMFSRIQSLLLPLLVAGCLLSSLSAWGGTGTTTKVNFAWQTETGITSPQFILSTQSLQLLEDILSQMFNDQTADLVIDAIAGLNGTTAIKPNTASAQQYNQAQIKPNLKKPGQAP